MKKLILASATILLMGTSFSLAAMPAIDLSDDLSAQAVDDGLQLARNGGDDSGGDNSGSGRGGHDDGDHDSGHDHDSGDDHNGNHHSSSDDDSSDNNVSGSGRKKPRIPGGSGCDDAGDIAEHASCRP